MTALPWRLPTPSENASPFYEKGASTAFPAEPPLLRVLADHLTLQPSSPRTMLAALVAPTFNPYVVHSLLCCEVRRNRRPWTSTPSLAASCMPLVVIGNKALRLAYHLHCRRSMLVMSLGCGRCVPEGDMRQDGTHGSAGARRTSMPRHSLFKRSLNPRRMMPRWWSGSAVLLRNNDRHARPNHGRAIRVLQSLPHRSIILDRGTEYPSPICRLNDSAAAGGEVRLELRVPHHPVGRVDHIMRVAEVSRIGGSVNRGNQHLNNAEWAHRPTDPCVQ